MACNDCIQTNDCLDKDCSIVDSVNVIYKPNGGVSQLACFLGLGTNTNIEEVLETLDQKLCELLDITILDCFKEKLELDGQDGNVPISLNGFFLLVQNYLCNNIDRFVKVSDSDTQAGYLNDKVELGECLDKSITVDSFGVQKLKISLNFPCISTKIPLCFQVETPECLTVDCTSCGAESCLPQPLVPVISLNVLEGVNVLSCTNCNGTVQWYNQNGVVVGAGNPLQITSSGIIKAKSLTQCGESDFSASIDIPIFITYKAIRKTYFVRDNCGKNSCNMNCVGSQVLFEKEYTSQISQDHASAIAEADELFIAQGQDYANTNGTCACRYQFSAAVSVVVARCHSF